MHVCGYGCMCVCKLHTAKLNSRDLQDKVLEKLKTVKLTRVIISANVSIQPKLLPQ